MVDLALRGSVGLFPVLIFLGVLVYLDSYKLVRFRVVLAAIAAGGMAALASYFVNALILNLTDMTIVMFARYVSPLVEEALKGLILVYLIRKHRIGFPVDAAIFGFAAGTGFAMIENLHFLGVLSDKPFAVWIIRGFGTAIMHGGAVAIFGIVAHTLSEEKQSTGMDVLAPGFLAGNFSESKVGRYLTSLREHFKPEVMIDLLCYLRLHVELSMRSTGMLMLRESGFDAEPNPEVQGMLEELRFLEKSIGRTGRMALKPFLRLSSRDLWQLYMLED
jgi:hypothetical protein